MLLVFCAGSGWRELHEHRTQSKLSWALGRRVVCCEMKEGGGAAVEPYSTFEGIKKGIKSY